ncbi:MAG: phosphonoacetaldehyde reductase [Lachnospiraceae bacterium]|nr:phosphonoacetaldehyde reductase [Lachnospiraceae bacterium]
MQSIIMGKSGMEAIEASLKKHEIENLFVVHGRAFYGTQWEKWIRSLKMKVTLFDEFQPNPSYTSVEKGVKTMRKNNCQAVLAIGGGSAIDVAKCIKLYLHMQDDVPYLFQRMTDNEIPFYAVPTTAGTGSESTCFAVIYYDGEKKSIEHKSCIPQIAVLDESYLISLPMIQKKATLLDALAHSIESFWSVNATLQSKILAKKAIQMIMADYKSYLGLENDREGNAQGIKPGEDRDRIVREHIFTASNLAGQAINITRTTAGHAMCYKLTTLFQFPHGIAVAECLPHLWHYMLGHMEQCIDIRGRDYLQQVFEELSDLLDPNDHKRNGAEKLEKIINSIGIPKMPVLSRETLKVLSESVNAERLKNNPVKLSKEDIYTIYGMLEEEER